LLEERAKQARPILALIERREQIERQRIEFEQITSDSSRLTDRKKRDPGFLLKEEKFRRTIEKEHPKLIAGLKQLLEEWETRHGECFEYDGKNYLTVIIENEAEELRKAQFAKQQKELDRQSRLGITPTKQSSARTTKTPRFTPARKVANNSTTPFKTPRSVKSTNSKTPLANKNSEKKVAPPVNLKSKKFEGQPLLAVEMNVANGTE